MDEPVSSESATTTPSALLPRMAAACLAVVPNHDATASIAPADALLERLDAFDAFVDETWPGSHASLDAVDVRNRAIRRREKALRSQARITAASGWATVVVKLSAASLGIGAICRLLGVG